MFFSIIPNYVTSMCSNISSMFGALTGVSGRCNLHSTIPRMSDSGASSVPVAYITARLMAAAWAALQTVAQQRYDGK